VSHGILSGHGNISLSLLESEKYTKITIKNVGEFFGHILSDRTVSKTEYPARASEFSRLLASLLVNVIFQSILALQHIPINGMFQFSLM
jgi:hypothetical protein